VATAVGIHPFLRVLYAGFAEQRCPSCGIVVRIGSIDAQVVALKRLLSRTKTSVEVVAPIIRNAEGSHQRLLTYLSGIYPADAISVDGVEWDGRSVAPDNPHDIDVRVGTVEPGAKVSVLRSLLAGVAALGTSQVTLADDEHTETLSRSYVCAGCGERVSKAKPQDFHGSTDAAGRYRLGGVTLPELLAGDVDAAASRLGAADLPARARPILEEVGRRLTALQSLGVGYLPLSRPSPTLSRGEAQRVRLAVILANRVEDLIHVLDEPTIGLDSAQVGGLLAALGGLRGPVVMVEHDRWAAADADRVVELGPGAGPAGGTIVFEGTPAALWKADTPSGRWFSQRDDLPRSQRRSVGSSSIRISGALLRNLDDIDCSFPLAALTVVTGPSGAGKTTLVRDVLLASLDAGEPVGCAVAEAPNLRTVFVDQSPIGRNPRSNPATYTGLAPRIRAIFARSTGMPASAFSFNRSEGACEVCAGMGAVEVRLAHLPSEWITCESCHGRRFNDDVLHAAAELGDGRTTTIAELYAARIDEVGLLLGGDRSAARKVQALVDVGLGYLTLGQPSPTLSGGEAQRVKLAKQLGASRSGDLVVLDEPTTGLHPADLERLLSVLHKLAERGSTVVVVEHNPDVIRSADHEIRLGPGGGPNGGRLIRTGPPDEIDGSPARPRARPRTGRRESANIRIVRARANNLRDVSVDIPKDAITAVVGVSGSGKSSLVRDVLEAEATRRLLECLSVYERQSVREGPEADVASVVGLGPTVAIGPERRLWDRRATVGSATDLGRQLGALLSYAGQRVCPECGGEQRRSDPTPSAPWICGTCRRSGAPAAPSHFSPSTYESACLRCHGVGTVGVPELERLIVHPDRPICDGAMHSPGFFPRSYLCRPEHGGYWMLQGLAARYGFDPATTPWNELDERAKHAFLWGEEDIDIPAEASRLAGGTATWRGVFSIVSGWDVGGLYTVHLPCPDCAGARLRPQYLDIHLEGRNRQALFEAPIVSVAETMSRVTVPSEAPRWVGVLQTVALRRLEFLGRVGLGYLDLDRLASTLSAGEAQRVKLASILGADLTGMTVLLDEPSRGLHPSEVEALGDVLSELRDAGNTVVLVDHDPTLVARADHLAVLGPGAGRNGGRLMATGNLTEVLEDLQAREIVEPTRPRAEAARRTPIGWMVIRKPTENNLDGNDVPIPLGVMTGVCGVSGSGKSTLVIDILARALDPPKVTTSVAHEEVRPGAHDGIEGAPSRVIHADQSRRGVGSPGVFLGVIPALRRRYAASAEAGAGGLDETTLVPRCDACGGRGAVRKDMSFLPSVEHPCDVCEATGYRDEVRDLTVRGASLPELERLTLEQVVDRWEDDERVARPLREACALGLGYLTLGQPSSTLSGGERQRLKLVRELSKPTKNPTLYILDEPTVGLHAIDVDRLMEALDGLVDRGHSVLIVEHDTRLLVRCDHLIELGPAGGPYGGRVVFAGQPDELAVADTPTSRHVAEALA
jgi:excinuclease ABC subunit A